MKDSNLFQYQILLPKQTFSLFTRKNYGKVSTTMLKFDSFESAVDGTFWETLANNKMEKWRLDDSCLDIGGIYKFGGQLNSDGTLIPLPSRIQVSAKSFSKDKGDSSSVWCPGSLKNTNTLQEFKELDKNQYLRDRGLKLLEDIKTGKAVKDPSLLVAFTLITFADLKKYKFYYWFAFPTIVPKTKIIAKSTNKVKDIFSKNQVEQLHKLYETHCQKDPTQKGFFLLKKNEQEGLEMGCLSDFKEYEKFDVYFGFVDPCGMDSTPGWPLRNYLLFLQIYFKLETIKVLCYRGVQSVVDSFILSIDLSDDSSMVLI